MYTLQQTSRTLLLMTLIIGVFFGISQVDKKHTPTVAASPSVELGLLELSPRGEAGGYAMPASGSSGGSSGACLALDVASFEEGSRTSITATASNFPGFRASVSSVSFYSCNDTQTSCTFVSTDTTSPYVRSIPVSTLAPGNYMAQGRWSGTTQSCTNIGTKDENCTFNTITNSICPAPFTVLAAPVAPTVSVSASVDGDAYSVNDRTGASAVPDGDIDSLLLSWSSSGTIDSCSVSVDTGSGTTVFSNLFNTTGYNPPSADEPPAGSTYTYAITCSGPSGSDTAQLAVERLQSECSDGVDNDSDSDTDFPADSGCADGTDDEGEPVAFLEVSIDGGAFQDVTEVEVDTDQTVTMRWNNGLDTSGTDACFGSGAGFAAAGAVTGTDQVVTPTNGNQTTFTIVCENTNGSYETASDSILVENPTEPITFTATPNVTAIGGDVVFEWDVEENDRTFCSIDGVALGAFPQNPILATSSSETLQIPASVTYTLTCLPNGANPGEIAEAEVRVREVIFEN